MKIEETIVTFLQGVSQHALAHDVVLREQLEPWEGQVVRVRMQRPYFWCYLLLGAGEVEFALEYEGQVQAHCDMDGVGLFQALYPPPLIEAYPISSCIELDGEPGLRDFLVALVQSWDIFSLLQTLCQDWFPWLLSRGVSYDDLQWLTRRFDKRIGGLANQLQALSKTNGHQLQRLDQMQDAMARQWRFMFALIILSSANLLTLVYVLIVRYFS